MVLWMSTVAWTRTKESNRSHVSKKKQETHPSNSSPWRTHKYFNYYDAINAMFKIWQRISNNPYYLINAMLKNVIHLNLSQQNKNKTKPTNNQWSSSAPTRPAGTCTCFYLQSHDLLENRKLLLESAAFRVRPAPNFLVENRGRIRTSVRQKKSKTLEIQHLNNPLN